VNFVKEKFLSFFAPENVLKLVYKKFMSWKPKKPYSSVPGKLLKIMNTSVIPVIAG